MPPKLQASHFKFKYIPLEIGIKEEIFKLEGRKKLENIEKLTFIGTSPKFIRNSDLILNPNAFQLLLVHASSSIALPYKLLRISILPKIYCSESETTKTHFPHTHTQSLSLSLSDRSFPILLSLSLCESDFFSFLCLIRNSKFFFCNFSNSIFLSLFAYKAHIIHALSSA